MASSSVGAVLFVKDLQRVAAFYANALMMRCSVSDKDHWRLECDGFELIVHQIPPHLAADIKIDTPPERRVWAAIRLDYPVADLGESRRIAQSLGGGIDATPPEWADPHENFYYGYDPEGNQFGVSERARR